MNARQRFACKIRKKPLIQSKSHFLPLREEKIHVALKKLAPLGEGEPASLVVEVQYKGCSIHWKARLD